MASLIVHSAAYGAVRYSQAKAPSDDSLLLLYVVGNILMLFIALIC